MALKPKSIYGIAIAILTLIVVTAAGSFLAKASPDDWTEHAVTTWYDPLSSSFTIDTAAKLAGVAKLVNDGVSSSDDPIDGFYNKILEIDTNLDLSAYTWVPIGTEARPFKGTLYSKNGTEIQISGMKLANDLTYAGFIGNMDGGTLGNFTFTGVIDLQSVTQAVYVGAAVGRMANNSTVYDIKNSIDIKVNTVTQVTYAGGIVGSGEGTIANSINNRPISIEGRNVYVGGIAGSASSNGLKIKKVTNEGTIQAKSNYNGDVIVGGIAGYGIGSILMDEEATPIENKAAVTATNGLNSFAGGIIGKADGQVTFSNLTTNAGAVQVNAPQALSSYAGGLIGAIATQQNNPLVSIEFTSTAPIANNGGTNAYTGGIAGYIGSSFTWGKNFTNIVSISATGAGQLNSGGLFGKVSGELRFVGTAKNSGNINVAGGIHANKPDGAYTGGLAGSSGSRIIFDSTANHAYANSGAITVNGGIGLYTGGIVGERAFTAAAPNVSSTANIIVNGHSRIYTGGFVGLVPNEGIEKALSGLTFAQEIKVTSTTSSQGNTVSSGGIVGYYVNASGTGTINQASFQGKLEATGGGAHTYTGGIAGYVESGTISNASVGSPTGAYATITADGNIGGVVGYLNGSIDAPSVKSVALTMKTVDGFAGGVAGKARGLITGALVGDASYAGSDSMTIAAAVASAADGHDRFTAGGIIGSNDSALTITNSQVTKIGLLNAIGRSEYNLGAVAGSLTAEAIVGATGAPVQVKDLTIEINAVQSYAGSAIGVNDSPEVFVQVERATINIPAASANAGGVIGLNQAISQDLDSAEYRLTAKDITITAQGNAAHIGGIVGENRGVTPRELAENVKITTTGSSNELGGIAGRNRGTINDSHVTTVEIRPLGTSAAAGGVVGYSESAGGVQPLAFIKDSTVLAGEEAIITATIPNTIIGGIVGLAKTTEISNSLVEAVIPLYATLLVQADHIKAGGIAGQIENSRIVGDSIRSNIENLLISTTAAATDSYIGGIVGYNDQTLIDKLAANKVNLIINSQRTIVGGMAAYNKGTATAIISNNYVADLNVNDRVGAAQSTIGGFVGVNDVRTADHVADPSTGVSTIQNSRYVGTIQAAAPSSVIGGMVGENRSLVANNSISDKIPVSSKGNNSTVGGLVGVNKAAGTLYYTYSNSNLTVEGEGTQAGGLVGLNEGKVIASYVDIDVTGNAVGTDGNSVFLGGLVGRNIGTIDKSHSTSKVTANGVYTNVGGLVGDHASGTITNSYVAKEVIANGANSFAGGLLGRITNGQVSISYSASQVTGMNGAYAGGFAGRYDNQSKDLLWKSYYVKDEERNINKDLPDFAEGNHLWLNVQARLSTILETTLEDRTTFPAWAGPDWDFIGTWKYGSPNASYKYPEINRVANSGGDAGSGNVNANINWYMRDKDVIFFDIRTEAELAGLAAIVNGSVPGVSKFDFTGRTIRVLNPIHIQSTQWVPIGNNEDNPFQGTFIGNNHLIDGLTLQPDHNYSGLFGVIGEQGSVTKIKMEPLSIAGNQFTGVLAGINKGNISEVDIRLLNGMKVSGGTVGALLGKNTGTLTAINLSLEDGSRVEAAGNNAIVGGFIGDNTSNIRPNSFGFNVINGSVGSSVANATVGGLIGKQTGDVTGIQVEIVDTYNISATGANNRLGGLIGRFAAGKAENITLTFGSGILKASGAGSTLGALIGQSDAGNTIKNVTVTTSRADQHLTGNGTIGGIVGMKEGSGNNTFDMENVRTEKILITSMDESAQAVVGGIAGKLTNTAVQRAEFAATIKAVGGSVTVGGIVGHSLDSILSKVDAVTDITSTAKTSEGAVGGIAGISASSNMNTGFDFGNFIPFYRGIYEATVHSHSIQVDGANKVADLYVGGITGKNTAASIYYSKAASDLVVNGAKAAAVGGLSGFTDGIIVSSAAQNAIRTETSVVYHVGGIAGIAGGGEIHYTNASARDGEAITIGTAGSKTGLVPATHAGGFVGMGDRTKITNSYTDVSIQILDSNQDNTIYAGGFAGLLGDSTPGDGQIKFAYAKGNLVVEGKTGVHVGGFAGSVDRYTITDAYATGNLSNTGFDTRSGGFAAAVERRATIKNAYALQAEINNTGVNHATRAYAGGFAGYNDGAIEGVYTDVPVINVTVTGANAYKGNLVGYNFRDGKILVSTHKSTGTAVGHNVGTVPGVTQADLTGALTIGDWNLDPDAIFLKGNRAEEVDIQNRVQLYTAVILYNDTSLEFYRLFNRTAVAKPSMNKISLGADIDLGGKRWVPFNEFTSEFDGKGHKIKGFKQETGALDTYGFFKENYGKIANVTFVESTIAAGSNIGVVTGVNHAGATISDVGVSATVKGKDRVGGITGKNEGLIERASVAGTISGTGIYTGGAAGENMASGTISVSFTYANIEAASAQAAAGGIAGLNSGTIVNVYNSGFIQAAGTDTAHAGGVVGYAAAGTISQALNYGEVAASVGGKLVRGKSYFGGIAGQKGDAATITHSAFNKQMLKTNTAYYNASGNRVSGETAGAAGMLSKDLAKGTLPANFSAVVWQAIPGFNPQLAAFVGTDQAKLSTVAIILNDKDLINRIQSDFQLTPDGAAGWSANPTEIQMSQNAGIVKGSLKKTGKAGITVTVGGSSRLITLNSPALQFIDAAVKPRVVSGDVNFSNEVSVVLTTDELEGKIYYTLDGTEPNETSLLYTTPIVLTSSTTIKAITIAEEKEFSEVLSGVWTRQVSFGGGGIFIPPPVVKEPAIGAVIGKETASGDGKTPVIVPRNSKLNLTAPEGQIIYYTTDGSTPTKNSPQFKGELLIKGKMTIKAITDMDDRVITINYEAENAKYEMKNDASEVKYISGYDQSTFKPDNAISRYELIEVIAPLLDMEEVSVGNLFSDVSDGVEDLVAFFASAGIIDGYPDGSFGGEKGLTRAEFVVVMSRVLKLNITNAGETILSDLKGHWAEKYVNAFTAAGYVNGFPDGTFQPEEEITRAQAVVVINRIIGAAKQNAPVKYNDLTPDHWAYEDIMAVVK